jgi:hypothetical protein
VKSIHERCMYISRYRRTRNGSRTCALSIFQKIRYSWPTFGSIYGKRISRTGRGGYVTLNQRSMSYVIQPMRQQRNRTLPTRVNYYTDLPVPREITSYSMCRLSKTSRLDVRTLYPSSLPTKKTSRHVWCINHGRKPY